MHPAVTTWWKAMHMQAVELHQLCVNVPVCEGLELSKPSLVWVLKRCGHIYHTARVFRWSADNLVIYMAAKGAQTSTAEEYFSTSHTISPPQLHVLCLSLRNSLYDTKEARDADVHAFKTMKTHIWLV
eukprot:364180-Chlamydomonas_euryale.AAC.15